MRRYLAAYLPWLPAERLIRSRAAPPDTPFVLTHKVKGGVRLFAVSAAAAALGLEPGLTLADARARLPDLLAFEHDPAGDAALLDWLADACDRYSPMVMADPPQGLVIDVTGCGHPFGGEAGLADDLARRLVGQGLTARLALADTPDAALALAEVALSSPLRGEATRALARAGGGGVHAIGQALRVDLPHPGRRKSDVSRLPPQGGGNFAAIRTLPITALRIPTENHLALRRAGLRRIGDLASRPRGPLAARFGERLTTLLARLLGEEDPRITPRRHPPAVMVEQRFAEPIAHTDTALASLDRLMGEAAAVLSARAAGGRRFEAALFRTDGHVARLAVETGQPSRDPKTLARLFRERIGALSDPLDPGFGYDLIRLVVPVTEALAPQQLRLEGGAVAEAELAALADRLAARLGRARVRRFMPGDSHIPEQAAFELAVAEGGKPGLWLPPEPGEPPQRPLHLFDPPQRIEVIAEVPDGPPRRFRWRRAMHEVARSEGPERIAAEWWKRRSGRGLTRDYYRVEDARGQRFWVFRHGLYGMERPLPDWYLHGLFA